MDLTVGNIIKIYWYTSKKLEIPENQKESLRNQGSWNQTEVILNRMMTGQADINDLKDSIKVGRDIIKKSENLKLTELNETWIQVGHHETKKTIKQIESLPNFQNWLDPVIIEEIKNK